MTPEQATAYLSRVAADLAEQGFDAVQIVASRIEPDGSTRSFMRGAGNWFARRGLCEAFIERDQADTQAQALGPLINPPDEGDKWKTEP
jgi:hypothetical protein